jgi:folate-binding protein YgfZ
MSSFLVHLSDRRLISMRGEQRAEYLHGQITVNTKHFDPTRARHAAHCDFKGKMWAVFLLTQYKDAFHMIMPKHSAQESLQQLKKYGVFSKVEIQDESQDWQILGGAGESVKTALVELFPDISDTHLSTSANAFGQVVCYNDTSLRYLISLKHDGYARLCELYDANIEEHSSPFIWQEIEAGIGYVEEGTIGEFVPQMFNLQALDAIDFDKGCYMGQEVVARTKFLGKNKRALYILSSDKAMSSDNLQPGALLEKSVGENWRRGGVIIQGCVMDQQTKILAVLANDTLVGDVLRLKDTEQRLEVLPLPYPLDN